MNHVSCPLCQNNQLLPYRYSLKKCGYCSVIVHPDFSNPSIVEEMQNIWFGEHYEFDEGFWDRIFQNMNHKRTLARIKRQKVGEGTILEVGVGNGSLLNFLKKRGFQVEGVDLSKALASKIGEVFGVKVFDGGLSSVPIDRKYDVIIAQHVIEHTSDPLEFLSKLKEHMHQKSLLVLAVPNIEAWAAILPGWVGYQPYHFIYFSEQTLTKALEKTGFKIQAMSSYESISGWVIAIIMTSRRLFSKGQAKPNKKVQKLKQNSVILSLYRVIMILFGGILAPLRWVQSKMGKGDELVVVALQQ